MAVISHWLPQKNQFDYYYYLMLSLLLVAVKSLKTLVELKITLLATRTVVIVIFAIEIY